MSRGRTLLQAPALIVLVALLFRLILIIPGHRAVMNPARDHFRFGWEMGRVASSIAAGRGFSSPYGGDTGPTAAQAPAYPYLLAGVFELLGTYSNSSAIAILVLNSLFSSLTCWTVFSIAREIFGATVAKWSAWAWAFYPLAVYISVKIVWETSLTAFILSLSVLLALRFKLASPHLAWLGFGALCGLDAWSCPVTITVLPVLFAWPAIRFRREAGGSLPGIGLAAMGFLLIATPWAVRNYFALHQFIPLRTNLGLELRVGNTRHVTRARIFSEHPSMNDTELEKYRRMGELNYMAGQEREAVEFIAENPGAFALLTIKRLGYWWAEGPALTGGSSLTGITVIAELFGYSLVSALALLGIVLAIRCGNERAILLGGILILYPLVYLVTLVQFRYRHPVEPFMVILCVYSIVRIVMAARGKVPLFGVPPVRHQIEPRAV